METKTSFTQAHQENQVWAKELTFYRGELMVFEKHLEEQLTSNTSMQESERADHFRNQFVRYREQAATLEGEIAAAEQKMAIYARSNEAMDMDQVNVADHAAFRSKIESFKASFEQLKQEYRDFETQLKA
jgi:uncharacterized coiled-coil DUF342 family protein